MNVVPEAKKYPVHRGWKKGPKDPPVDESKSPMLTPQRSRLYTLSSRRRYNNIYKIVDDPRKLNGPVIIAMGLATSTAVIVVVMIEFRVGSSDKYKGIFSS